MFTYPFEILKARLIAEVTEQREVDWYLDQDNTKDKNASLKAAPAIFIEFLPVQAQDQGLRIQQAESEFNVILLTDCVFDTGSKRLKKDNARDHMRIFDKIYIALSGYSAKLSVLPEFVALQNTDNDMRIMNSITRIAIAPPHMPRKALMKSVQRFKTIIWDHAAQVNYNPPVTPPGLLVTAEFEG